MLRSRYRSLYVSHDISEVERLADYMVLLDAGRVVAAGPLSDVLADSRLPIARSPEASSVLEARVGAFDPRDGLTALDIDGETLLVPRRVGEAGHHAPRADRRHGRKPRSGSSFSDDDLEHPACAGEGRCAIG